jgi:hypothetical protein
LDGDFLAPVIAVDEKTLAIHGNADGHLEPPVEYLTKLL